VKLLSLAALAGILLVPGTTLFFESGRGVHCTSCHEMQPVYDTWHQSSHRVQGCEKCHGGALTLDPKFHLNNLSRAWNHLRGDLPEQLTLGHRFAIGMNDQCRSCHQQEFAAWQSGGHSATYQRIFLDRKSNSSRILMDDCLRCHGMYFEGGIRDLVGSLKQGAMTQMPTIPCVTCHELHREGSPMRKDATEKWRPSLAFYDRRSQRHIPLADLPMPSMMEGSRVVRMSPDRRQALCYQCHAPIANMQVGTGDDRTGIGVHEGISCLACHAQHGQKTRASCASCHPKMSNCGLDVEKMDTTFASLNSKHNIHWVKCADCHTHGVPRKLLTRRENNP
jgi:hypothetical protein